MWKALCLVGLLSATSASAAEPTSKLSDVDRYNYVVGTQAFAACYQFTGQPKLIEMAQAMLDMGSNVIKFGVGKDTYYEHKHGPTLANVPAADPNVHNLTDLFAREPSHRKVLEMPFAYYVIWAYPFSCHLNGHQGKGHFTKPMTAQQSKQEYDELREFVSYLLKTYSGTGKTFYLGHWEGDWLIRGDFDLNHDLTDAQTKNMAAWLNLRQKAVDDAKRETPHHGVDVFHYMEVNLVQQAMQGKRSLTNNVLPLTNVDYVSYSSYDTITLSDGNIAANLPKALDYIESKLPAKPGIVGKRVFVGEYGFPSKSCGPTLQAENARKVMKAGLTWGCPFVLYWEMYNNEYHNGQHYGFWLIDDKGEKQPAYFTHKRFYNQLRPWVADFQKQHGRLPSHNEFCREAVRRLDAAK